MLLVLVVPVIMSHLSLSNFLFAFWHLFKYYVSRWGSFCIHPLGVIWAFWFYRLVVFVRFEDFCHFLKKILFIYEKHRERGRGIDRGRSRLLAGSLMRDSIPGPGIMPWAEGRCSTAEPPSRPYFYIVYSTKQLYIFSLLVMCICMCVHIQNFIPSAFFHFYFTYNFC